MTDMEKSGQVSAWVPIIVGIIGLVGIIAGQFVNAWREDRRWNRERDREEIHWNRTRQFDDAIHWRETRVRLYAQYNSLMRDFIQWHWRPLLFLADEEQWKHAYIHLQQEWHDLSPHVYEVLLVCSDELEEKLFDCSAFIEEAIASTVYAEREKVWQTIKDIERLHTTVIAYAKAELHATATGSRYASK